MARDTFGPEVRSRDMRLYRDSPFVDRVRRRSIATAYLLFPLTGTKWHATVADGEGRDEGYDLASWSIPAEQTMQMPAGAPVELWLDGVAETEGVVRRYGG